VEINRKMAEQASIPQPLADTRYIIGNKKGKGPTAAVKSIRKPVSGASLNLARHKNRDIPMTETIADNRGEHQFGGIVLILKRIAYSRKPVMVTVRYFLILTAVVAGIANMRMWWQSFHTQYIFKKDFIQEYLISKSVLAGVDPYLPLPILADRFMGPLPDLVFQHPTPHPPPVALLCLPLGWLTYEHAAIVWFFFELICLSVSVVLLLRWFGVERRVLLALLSALLILVWTPITSELVIGQLNALLFVLLIGAWGALRSGNDIRGGFFLGTAIAVKLMPWPLIIFLMLRRNWRAACAALSTTIVANVAVASLIGFDRVAHYYLKIGKSVSSLYHAQFDNFSLWTIGWRMFVGTGIPVSVGVNLPPLFTAPAIAPFISIVIPFAMLIYGLIFALQARTFDTSFGILICLMILVSPVAWDHYLLSALIPLVIVFRNLYSLNWPRKETNIALWIGIMFFFSARIWMPLLTGNRIAEELVPTISYTVSLLSLLPAIGLLGLLWLLRGLDRFAP
jgi:hypothetical protein